MRLNWGWSVLCCGKAQKKRERLKKRFFYMKFWRVNEKSQSHPWMSNWIWAESASFRFLSVTHYWLGQIQVNASSQQTLGSSISLSLSLSLPLILNFSVLNLSFLCSVFRFPIVDETENLSLSLFRSPFRDGDVSVVCSFALSVNWAFVDFVDPMRVDCFCLLNFVAFFFSS